MGTCQYPSVQVYLQVFDPQIWVTHGKNSWWVQVLVLSAKIPAGAPVDSPSYGLPTSFHMMVPTFVSSYFHSYINHDLSIWHVYTHNRIMPLYWFQTTQISPYMLLILGFWFINGVMLAHLKVLYSIFTLNTFMGHPYCHLECPHFIIHLTPCQCMSSS